jgi:Ala-tRNA(Pro) deacylase
MIPTHVHGYLNANGVPSLTLGHPSAISSQDVASALGITGWRVAKTVVMEADGRHCLAVLPAPDIISIPHLSLALGARSLRVLGEEEFAGEFRDCAVGAEPPFGRLYGMPLVVDVNLGNWRRVVFRAGSRTECVELEWTDYVALERPLFGEFARRAGNEMPFPFVG